MSKKNKFKIAWLEKAVSWVDILLQFLLFVLSYIVPKKSHMLVFWAWAGYICDGNPKYIYLYSLTQKEQVLPYWITKNKEIYHTLSEKWYPVLYMYSFKWFAGILRARFLINDHSSKDISYILSLFWRFQTLQTWHGTPLKKIWIPLFQGTWAYNSMKQYLIRREYKKDIYICSPSRFISQIFQEVFDYSDEIPVTWYPRNDIYFNPTLIKSQIPETLWLSNYKKVITYAPTYRDNNSITPLSKSYIDTLHDYCVTDNYLFVLKLHPFDSSMTYDFDWYTHIKKVSKHIDLQELLTYTDVLITDYSSVFFDYMVTQKPVIYYCYDYELYMQDRWMLMDYFTDLPWPFIKTEGELLNCLDTIDTWFYDKEYMQKYNACNDTYNFYKDGKSSERVFNLILTKLQWKK